MTFGRVGRPETSFVETPRGSVAYQIFGEGQRDILFLTHWMTNVDGYWDEPSAVRYFDRLGAMGRVILIDKLGTGVSDMTPNGSVDPLEYYIDETLTVLDAVAVDSAVLIGDTEGGMLAAVLAASHPDRFPELVLVNSYPRLRRAEDYPIGAPEWVVEETSRLWIAQHGTTGDTLIVTAPSVADDLRFRQWFIRFQRSAMKPKVAAGALNWIANTDVRAVLPLIQSRTLVVHRRDARYHRLTYGRYLADNIPGASLEVVPGADTLPFHAGDFGPTLDRIEEFLTGHREQVATTRMLSTVLFTDIVGSTALAADIGDERWLDLRSTHDRIVKATLDRFRGQEVALTGDGAVATFDGPQRAILCALAIREEVEDIGLQVRAGIHTGEIEMRDDQIGGIAVNIASRVMDAAEDGGVMVSSTVKDLVVGSPLQFESCGSFDLKGVPGPWQLFEVLAVSPSVAA